ncbi:MAG: thioredoxin family protein [Actinobacteria bacterium]|nr:thioredoxin family protein [Actinomycetota bacterium]
MTVRLVVAAVLLGAAVAIAWWLNRRRPAPPPRDTYPLPRQLDRTDFVRADAPWLVVLFSSATCDSCARMAPKVRVLESADVAVDEVEYNARADLHERYAISGVPMVLLVDGEGVVRNGFVGPASATDLWAAVAEMREPGISPEPGLGALP